MTSKLLKVARPVECLIDIKRQSHCSMCTISINIYILIINSVIPNPELACQTLVTCTNVIIIDKTEK